MKTRASLARATFPNTLAGRLRTARATRLLLLLLTLPAVVQAQFNYATSNGTITIAAYTGPGGAVTIPDTINGLPVTSIADAAFWGKTLTSVTIPNSVTSIGAYAFYECGSLAKITMGNSVTNIGSAAFYRCTRLTNVTIPTSMSSIGDHTFSGCTSLPSVTIPDSVTSIGGGAFGSCSSLTSITIPDSVTNIGDDAFYGCASLISVTIGTGVTSIGDYAFSGCGSLSSVMIPSGSIGGYAFYACGLTNVTIGNGVTSIAFAAFEGCTSLTGVYFAGNAPSLDVTSPFGGDTNAVLYYLPGTTGWTSTFGGRPTELWFLPNPLILTIGPSFGVKTNQFGFIISWATNIPVVVEAFTNLANPAWSPLATNTLSNGSSYFSDPQWTNFPGRFYRLRSP